MRNIVFASVALFLATSSASAFAARTGNDAPPTEDAQAAPAAGATAPVADQAALPVPPPPRPVVRQSVLTHITGRVDAASLESSVLWTEYEVAFATFEDRIAKTDSDRPTTARGHRLYVDAIEASINLRDLLQELLKRPDQLSGEERVDALDSFLTIEQVAGSLMVEIEECKLATTTLRGLMNRPETQEREILVQSTQRWLDNAERCVVRQNLEDTIASQEASADQAELQRLRGQLAAAQATEGEERAAQAEASASGDELVLSRSELLQILRSSAEERRAQFGGDFDFFVHPRANIPTHEYGFEFRGGFLRSPEFGLDIMYDVHASHWDPRINMTYGGSFFVRKNRRSQLSLNVDWADLQTDDHWWVQRRRARSAAKWVENDAKLLSITMGVDVIAPLTKNERLQFYFGGLFGISANVGSVYTTKVDAGTCLTGVSGSKTGETDRFEPGGVCFPTIGGESTPVLDASTRSSANIPVVLPSIGLQLGLRYVIADRVQLSVGGGLRDIYFYGNVGIGVIVARKYKNR